MWVNQNLGSWTLNQEVDLDGIFSYSYLDCDHYTATLVGWRENNPHVINREMGANGREFGTSAVQARDWLIQEQGWVISGDSASEETCGALVNTNNLPEGEEIDLHLFPNPASNVLLIRMSKGAEVRVFNTLGVLQGAYLLAGGVSELNISDWKSGVYILSTGNQVAKFIKL